MVLIYKKKEEDKFKFKRSVVTGLFLFMVMFSLIFPNNSKPIITGFDIVGLTRTQDYIIRREIEHPLNAPFDSLIAELDKNRIINLGLFENVTWRIIPENKDKALLQFIIIESFHALPPLLFPSYDEEKGWSLKGLYLINNYKGKNISAEINASIGGQKKIQFMYYDPWIIGSRVSLFFFIDNNEYDHLFLDKTVVDKLVEVEIGKHFNQNFKLKFSQKLFRKVFIDKYDKLSFNYYIPEIMIDYDTRDIYWSPRKGFRLINKIAPMFGKNSFLTFDLSSSIYIPLFGRSTITPYVFAINTTLKRKWGYKNDVWLNYFGNSFNIRGWEIPDNKTFVQKSNNYRFGHEYSFFSMELRKLIMINNNILMFSKGLDLVCFFDGGYIAENIISSKKKKLICGVGFGFRIPFPLLECFRLDFAWGFKNNKINSKPSIHFAIKQKF